MGKAKYQLESDFSLQGQIVNIVRKDNFTPKRVQLSTEDGQFFIKLAKPLRATVPFLAPGDWVSIAGTRKIKKGRNEFKAEELTPLSAGGELSSRKVSPLPVGKEKKILTQGKILVCQKSDCCKRGGKAVYQALEKAIDDRGLSDRVDIKKTGCLKHCKAGPNLVFMPSKTRHSRIRPAEVSELVDKHFLATANR
ncbi:(2Fe-2S) ferredoxin domain-containing protein [Oscillatoriales cyanobacterium LEGE 11467]|uniref:(2Fe-2S) ferredoxin domain-containing protein n=1 Tax=Zarconia navalis LEGE 11467 TaxID=1828826 RepID=A0A928VWR9_9CYAN|nr:(2Fe-2S) ferredoxin domain-containing protein [Zarconia navalis]MBE9041556.1 (2Fe-2S) ferredoxin domain-containing protein [Zarconia navalis LEGE 11467]